MIERTEQKVQEKSFLQFTTENCFKRNYFKLQYSWDLISFIHQRWGKTKSLFSTNISISETDFSAYRWIHQHIHLIFRCPVLCSLCHKNKKLSCCREGARRSVSFKILLSHLRSFEITPLSRACVSSNYPCLYIYTLCFKKKFTLSLFAITKSDVDRFQ